MIRLKLSDAYCRDAAPGVKNIYIYDLQVTHLALKVTPAGGKSFYYIRSVGGKMQYIRIGPFPAVSVAGARSAALQMDLNAAKGLDLIPDSSVYTLGDCISGYLTNREERKGPPGLLRSHGGDSYIRPHPVTAKAGSHRRCRRSDCRRRRPHPRSCRRSKKKSSRRHAR